MSKLDKDAVIAKFTEAYQAANGKAPEIEAKGGWYSIDGGKNLRLAALDEMANELSSGTTPAPAKAEKETAAKPAAKKKAPAKKAAKSKSAFSVKAFWSEKTADGSRQPR